MAQGQIDQARTIAGLLDAEIERRRPRHLAEWAAAELDLTGVPLLLQTEHSGLTLDLLALQLDPIIADAITVSGASGNPDPMYRMIDLAHQTVEVPVAIRAAIPAGTTYRFPFGIELRPWPNRSILTLATTRRYERAARRLLAELDNGTADLEHPYRLQTLRLDVVEGRLEATAVAACTAFRGDLALDDQVWEALDRDVHAPLRHAPRLLQRGLGASRGVLLHGPPGTGKTAICRVLAAEVTGTATVLMPTADAIATQLDSVFALARSLAPTLLILEDIDLVAGRRSGRPDRNLSAFLANLDGLLTGEEPIITVASTNDPDALDQAATRANRIDRLIEIPRPTLEGRRRIWTHYLADDAPQLDARQLAASTSGATGADIRELVRTALLEDTPPTTNAYLQLIADHRPPTATHGQYL